MKMLPLILVLVFVTNFGISQNIAKDFLPILFDTVQIVINAKRNRLEIKDTHISDTLRIGFKVSLEFKYPLSDTNKVINIKSIKLISLDIKSLTSNNQYHIDLIGKNKLSGCKRDIWNRYSEIFKYWYKNQPYDKMIDRQAYGDKAYFGGVLYAVP